MRGSRFALCLLLLGCLPEAARPEGDHLVAERGLSRVAVAPAPSTQIGFTRAAGPVSGDFGLGEAAELVAVSRTGGAPRSFGRAGLTGFPPAWDAAGGLYVRIFVNTQGDELVRYPPEGGPPVELPGLAESELSPSQGRFYYAYTDGMAWVIERDGVPRPLPTVERFGLAAFVGEELYLVNQGTLGRLAATDVAPVRLRPGVKQWWRAGLPDGEPVLLAMSDRPLGGIDLTLIGPGPAMATISIDRPVVGFPAASPDGARVAWVEQTERPGWLRLRARHTDGGGELAVDLEIPELPSVPSRGPGGPGGPPVDARLALRPGSDDVLCFLNGKARLLRGDGTLAIMDDRLLAASNRDPRLLRGAPVGGLPGPRPALDLGLYTRDGRRWLYSDPSGAVLLADADDPHAPGFPLGPRDEVSFTSEPAPGQLLAWTRPGNDRTDLHVVDLVHLQRRVLAENVGSTVAGHARVVARVRLLGRNGPGDLALIDLLTGAEHVLSRNVTEFDLEPVCAACDPTAAGVAVAYVVNARVPFDHDGLWTVQLP